jgi:hypothetical protein
MRLEQTGQCGRARQAEQARQEPRDYIDGTVSDQHAARCMPRSAAKAAHGPKKTRFAELPVPLAAPKWCSWLPTKHRANSAAESTAPLKKEEKAPSASAAARQQHHGQQRNEDSCSARCYHRERSVRLLMPG